MSIDEKLKDANGMLKFIDHHRPALPDGDYSITVTQSIQAKRDVLSKTKGQPSQWLSQEVIKQKSFKSQTRTFAVQGPRFNIDPQLIHAVFPPAGSLGEHSSLLPHISFKRSSLPWERFAFPLNDKLAPENDPALKCPWMALLVFDQSEFPEKSDKNSESGQVEEATFASGTVSDIKSAKLSPLPQDKPLYWAITPESTTEAGSDKLLALKFPYESGQQADDALSIIDVDRQLLASILPTKPDLLFTAHVRQAVETQQTPPDEAMTTLLANRLPRPGRMSVVHLVSLEGLYGNDNLDIWSAAKNTEQAFIRLVSLKSWRFTCVSEEHSFKGLARGLDRAPSTLRLPDGKLTKALPYIKRGFVGLPHQFRNGAESVSWYHGPLVPGQVTSIGYRPCVHNSDQLLRINPENQFIDTSYAAAWELGRLLTLQNEKVAVSLFNWKRRHRHESQRLAAMMALEHLPIEGKQFDKNIPQDVSQWFADMALLKGLPFNYLVPDERMLPQESMRLFWLDPDWIRALHDGAFSIGRVLTQDHDRDSALDTTLLDSPHAAVTGLLLRSELVSGWPDLLIDGYDERVDHSDYEHPLRDPDDASGIFRNVAASVVIEDALNLGELDILTSHFGFAENLGSESSIETLVEDKTWLVNIHLNKDLYIIKKREQDFLVQIENKLPLIRMVRLSPNVLLCLFSGEVKTIDVHQKPEALHFGLNRGATLESVNIASEKTEAEPTQTYYRDIKDPKGGETTTHVDITSDSWKDEARRVLNISALAAQIEDQSGMNTGPFTSAQFAFQMALGVQKVRFTMTT